MKKINKIEGLGDIVSIITRFFKIDVLAEKIAKLRGKKDCGCERRRKTLNKWMPFNKK
jgi:hypothetical protein